MIGDGVTALSRGTTLTAAATVHVKGAYAQIMAATAAAEAGFLVQLGRTSTGVDFLVDIAIGGAGSETVIVANLACGAGTGAASRKGAFFIPIPIRAGTRISARCQATTISTTVDVKVHLLGSLPGGMDSFGKCVTYGANTATTQHTTVDPGATINTNGAWTQIVAATDYACKAIIVDHSNLVQLTRTACNWMVDIAIGAAAAETAIIQNLHFECVTTEDAILHGPTPILPVAIRAGARISARASCGINTATVRNIPIGILALS